MSINQKAQYCLNISILRNARLVQCKKINEYNMPYNRFKGKKHMIIDAGKAFLKNPTHFLDNNNQKTRNRRKVSLT